MKRAIRTILILIPFLCVSVIAQQQNSVLQPTEIQGLRLQVKYKDAQLKQIALQQAQQAFNQSLVELTDEGKKVIEENKWPKDTIFDPNKISFSLPTPPTPKPEEKKKP